MESPNREAIDPADIPPTERPRDPNEYPVERIPEVIDPAEMPSRKKPPQAKGKPPTKSPAR